MLSLLRLDCIILPMIENMPLLALAYRYNSITTGLFPCVYKKCFQKCFHGVGFDAIIACHENQYTSQLDLRPILLNDYIISTE